MATSFDADVLFFCDLPPVAYVRRREKNNIAVRKSREKKRQEIKRFTDEHAKLKREVDQVRAQNEKLRHLVTVVEDGIVGEKSKTELEALIKNAKKQLHWTWVVVVEVGMEVKVKVGMGMGIIWIDGESLFRWWCVGVWVWRRTVHPSPFLPSLYYVTRLKPDFCGGRPPRSR